MCREAPSGIIIGYAAGDWSWIIDWLAFRIFMFLPVHKCNVDWRWYGDWILPRVGNWSYREDRAALGLVQN